MKVTILVILSIVALFFLSSCAYEQPTAPSPKIYVVDENSAVEVTALEKPKSFVVVEQDDSVWLEEESEKRKNLNKVRALRDFEDEQEEFELESRYKNVRRVIDDELVRGYIPEIDNPEFKEVDK